MVTAREEHHLKEIGRILHRDEAHVVAPGCPYPLRADDPSEELDTLARVLRQFSRPEVAIGAGGAHERREGMSRRQDAEDIPLEDVFRLLIVADT